VLGKVRRVLSVAEVVLALSDVLDPEQYDVPGDRAVRSVHLWVDESPVEEGALVAAPGRSVQEALAASAGRGAAAVLLRRPEHTATVAEVLSAADDRGLPLLWLRPGCSWVEVLGRLRDLLTADPAPGPRVGPAPAGDLFGLADEIAAAVGGPVIIEDASFRVLAYSAFVGEMDRGRAEAILGRRTPDPWLDHLAATGSLDRLHATDEVVDLPDGPWQARRRLITAVRAGTRSLGVVWVAEGATPLPEGAGQALRRAVDRAVPLFLRHRERADAEADRRSRLVRVLLEGRAAALPAAAEFGMGVTGSFVVLAASTVGAASDRRAGAVASLGTDDVWSRLADHVTLCCESFRRPAAATRFGNHVVAVVEVDPRTGDDGLRRLVEEVVRLAGTGRLALLHAAVSSVGTGVGSLGRLRDEAVAALGALADRPGSAATRFQDVEAEVLVRAAVARLDPGTSLTALDRLVAHDRSHRSELVPTLRAYLDACGAVAATATRLGVHATTVRHRLERIETVSGTRLDRPEVRLALDLLLRREPPV
jgi:hypothetical protein